MIQLLGSTGIDFNKRNAEGRSALSLAAMNGHSAVVWLLLCRNGTEISVKDRTGLIPLQHAARYGNISVLQILLAESKVPNYKDDSRGSLLSHAAKCGQAAATEMLMARYNMSPDEPVELGGTSLIWAIRGGH
ncbi:ankyrin repeat-containing domain protein [Aspergillus pseudonomiae]|uniref:Ankyrin repeat-containing domain protein n=1 Tax=Aspergillus pseudonomiae TaxID=1506151 RepID=A0A5N7DK76_9EURO|nr:ankyrin repeat-containing domain protein [Aspergillus pseudonomiae]KAE8406841.1 ankyrin repeat-containing domain protein [Aspergillus pseudonomiae]